MTDLNLLKGLRLGTSVAEEERVDLKKYFFETDAWARLLRGDVDVVYGGKGTGKSALYLLLDDQKEKLLRERNLHIVPGENANEDPVFKVFENEGIFSEKDFISVWKFYLLSLIGNYVRENLSGLNGADSILKRLEAAELIPATGIRQALKMARHYLSQITPTIQHEGVKFTISIDEPSLEQEKKGVVSASFLIKELDSVLKKNNHTIWVLLDRLDIAFTEPKTETPALRALFRMYRDMSGLDRLKLKIFLRDDIWSRVTREQGFREQSHITKTLTIRWTDESLRHLVLNRFFANSSMETFTGIQRSDALTKAPLQKTAMAHIFPLQVESGLKKSETFDWIIKRVQDGKQNSAPREVIHLITCAVEEQIRITQTGGTGSECESLLSPDSLKSALDKVSQRKIETFYSEYANLRSYIEAFKGMKTEHNSITLSSMFKSHGLKGDLQKVIKDLIDIGFLQEKRLVDGKISYWVPFIFRPFLNMVQGPAFEKERVISVEE